MKLKTQTTLNQYSFLFLITSLLFSFCSCQNEDLAGDYDKSALADFYQVDTNDLWKVFQNKLKKFDERKKKDNRIQIVENVSRDSLILKHRATEVKLILDYIKPNHFEIGNHEIIDLTITKQEFIDYYEPLHKNSKFSIISRLFGLYEYNLLTISDTSLESFIKTSYEKLIQIGKYKEINENYLKYKKLFRYPAEKLEEMEMILDTVTARSSWGKHVDMMYILAQNGRIEKAYHHFNRLVLETIAQKDDPFFIDYGITELQHEKLMFTFIKSKNIEMRNKFLQLAFDLIKNNSYGLDPYTKLPRILINCGVLTETEKVELLHRLKTTKNFHGGLAGRDYELFLKNVDFLKNASKEYIADTLSTHQFHEIIKADLSEEDIKYIDEFLEEHHHQLEGGRTINPKTKQHFLKKYLTTPFNFDTIQAYFAKGGIIDTTSYEEFVKYYESAEINTISYLPFNKYVLKDYIPKTNNSYVYFTSKGRTWSLPYIEIILQFSKGFEQEFGEKLHFLVERNEKSRGNQKNAAYIIYIFTKHSKVYEINLGEARDLMLQYKPLLQVLNSILIERGSSKRWVSAMDDSHHKKYWLIEPAAFEFIDETLGIL